MSKKTGSFDITGTDTNTWTLNNGNTGVVESGGSLSTTTSNPSVTFGNGTTSLTNSGTIVSTGDRALYGSGLSNGSSVTVTNNAGAKILGSYPATGASGENNDAFKIKTDFSGGSVTVNNSGYLVAGALNGSNQIVLASGATTSGQALDFDDISSSLVTINNYAGGVIGAADSDAIRPGGDTIINNYGKIAGQSAGSTGNDGIDFQSHASGSATINNYSTGSITGARDGITGNFSITVNNSGTITGQLGSGLNMDTTSGTTNVTNNATGIITGNASGVNDGDGIDVDYLVNLQNYGKVNAYGTSTGSINEAVTVGGGTIDNYSGGQLYSVQRAITVDDSNLGDAFAVTTILNQGDISGTDNAADNYIGAISITSALNNSLTNSGTIEGSILFTNAAGDTTFGNNTVTNSGTITGNITFGGGGDAFNESTGGSVSGTINGGSGTDTVTLSGSGSGTLSGVQNFEVLQVSAGHWTVTDGESYASGTTIASGAILQLGNGGTSGSLSGSITDNGTLVLDRSNGVSVSGISGGGSVQISGSATLTGTNSYSGGTVIEDGGTLELGSAAAAGSGAITFVGDPTLIIDGTTMPTNTIDGFVPGDLIELTSIANVPGSHVDMNYQTNVLTITEGSNTYQLNFNPEEDFSGYYFHLSSVDGGTEISEDQVACYCRGTLIATDRGEVAVEHLGIGDSVVTASGATRSIRWIGRRSYGGRFAMGRKEILPVCIKAGALDEKVPRRDLWISPHHAMYLDGVLIEAKDLVNGVSVVQAERVETVEYFHIELDSHDVILAEGAASETFIDDDSRGMFHNAHEYRALYPDADVDPDAQYCAPRLSDGYEMEATRDRIARRAGLRPAGQGGQAGALRGFVDFIGPHRIAGWAQDAVHPEAPVCLDVYADERLIGQVLANQYRDDLANAGVGSGRHSFAFALPAGVIASQSLAVRRSLDGAVLRHSAQAAAAA